MLKAVLSSMMILLFHTMHAQRSEVIHLADGDDSKGMYTIIYPEDDNWSAFMVLVPGLFESSEKLLIQTELPTLAAAKGIATIIPTFQNGPASMAFDSVSQNILLNILAHVNQIHDLESLKFYIGGFSIGGSCAVKYAEMAIENNYDLKPDALFAIDPPLDFERFYHSRQRENRLNLPADPSGENTFMILNLEEIMNGTPEQSLENYQKISPYSRSDTTQQAIKNLVHTPIRLYTEPDIMWWLGERGGDLSGMNALDCSAMINELNRLGNAEAFLIITENKGYRKPDNKRHPHSWSIVDNNELIEWLLAY